MMADGVAVDRRGLVRQLRSSGGDGAVFVRFRTGGDRHAALDAMAAASEAALVAANPSGGPDSDLILALPPAVTPHGPVVFISSCDTVEALETWLSVVADELTAAGWSGRLMPIRPVDTPYDVAGGQVDCVSLGLVLPVDHAAWFAARSKQPRRMEEMWLVEEAATQTALEQAAAFWLAIEGDYFFNNGGMQFRIDAGDAWSLLDGVRGRLPQTKLTTAGRDGTAHRVVFNTGGHVIYELHPADGDWLAAAQQLTGLLRVHAAIAEYGLVRLSWIPGSLWDDLHHRPPRLPHVTAGYPRVARDLESSYVPDAYGVQLLSEPHLARAGDLSRWQVTELNDGRYLVVAADLDAWFNHDQPAQQLLEQARHDFDPMILRDDDWRQARGSGSPAAQQRPDRQTAVSDEPKEPRPREPDGGDRDASVSEERAALAADVTATTLQLRGDLDEA